MMDHESRQEPSVCVMMLSWNDAQNTLECLRSVYQMDYPHDVVLVVDNASSEETVQAICGAYPEVELIVNPTNLGFGGGANVGFERAVERGVDYVLFVNNDTLLEPTLLTELVRAAQAHPRAGLLVPKIYYYRADGHVPGNGQPQRIWAAGARWAPFPPRIKMIGRGRLDGPQYGRPRRLDFATGCALLIRRQVLETVGGFDPIYWPAYQEDYDFSACVTEAGWEIWYVPEARLWHKETRSRQRIGSRNKAFNLGKNTVPLFARHFTLVTLWVHVAWVTVREAVKMNWSFIGPYLAGVRAGWANRTGEAR